MPGFRVAPNNGFNHDTLVKSIRDDGHLKFIKRLPSMITGEYGVDPAHVNFPNSEIGKPSRGQRHKSSDWFVLPLSRKLHDEQHSFALEKEWWQMHGIEQPQSIALHLYAYYMQKKLPLEDRIEQAAKIIRMVNQNAY